MDTQVVRLGSSDVAVGQELFALMARVFEEETSELGPDYVAALLGDDSFWAYAALSDGEILGGLTAHVLPMTRSMENELMIYDLAVSESHQRSGVGSALVLRAVADATKSGINSVVVPAEDVDEHALAFYQALGADATDCTFFTFNAAPVES